MNDVIDATRWMDRNDVHVGLMFLPTGSPNVAYVAAGAGGVTMCQLAKGESLSATIAVFQDRSILQRESAYAFDAF